MRIRIGLNTLFLEQFWALKHHYYLCSFFSDLRFAVLGTPDGEKEEPILRRQMTKLLARREKTPKSSGLCTGLTCLWGIAGLGLCAAHTHRRHPTAATECCIVALGPSDQWPLFTASIKAGSAWLGWAWRPPRETGCRGSQIGNSPVTHTWPHGKCWFGLEEIA